jgi:hypothetical protein
MAEHVGGLTDEEFEHMVLWNEEAMNGVVPALVSEFGNDSPEVGRWISLYNQWTMENTKRVAPAEPSKDWEGWNK